jgi:hypothetical protein
MTYRGHVKNGQIALDEEARLPEGAKVNVEVVEEPGSKGHRPARGRVRRFQPIEMTGGSLAEELVRDRR